MKIQMNHIDICFESRFSIEQLETVHRVAPDSMVLESDNLELYVIYTCSEPCEAEIDEYGIGFYVNSLITGKAVLHCPYPKSVLNKIDIDKIGTEEGIKTLRDEVALFIGNRLEYMNQIEDQMEDAYMAYLDNAIEVVNKIEVPAIGVVAEDDDNNYLSSCFRNIETGV